MNENIERVFLTQTQIQNKVAEAAAWLDRKFEGKTPLAVCVLKGSVLFFGDLIRAMQTPVELDFMSVSSYGNSSVSSGAPRVTKEPSAKIEGRDILLVEDIIDSGHTLAFLRRYFKERGASSFTAVTLLNKPCRRETCEQADYTCVDAGDEFLVGYGLDYAEQYRNLPYIGILKREAYE